MRCLLNFCSDWKSFLVISTVHNFCVDLKFSVPSNIDVSSTPLYFQELFWRNGDTDAKIFPHIRCRLPSLHLYLAPLLTFPWGCSTVVRDYWQPSSCSPALPFFLSLSLPSSLCLSHCQHSAVDLIRMWSLLPTPENIVQDRYIAPKVNTYFIRADGKPVKLLATVCTA